MWLSRGGYTPSVSLSRTGETRLLRPTPSPCAQRNLLPAHNKARQLLRPETWQLIHSGLT